jgi:hypothetical protein
MTSNQEQDFDKTIQVGKIVREVRQTQQQNAVQESDFKVNSKDFSISKKAEQFGARVDFNEDGVIDGKDQTLYKVVKIALSAFSGVVLVAALVVILLLNIITPSGLGSSKGGRSDVTIPTKSTHSVCFSAPTVDEDLSNDEEFGSVRTPTASTSQVGTIGSSSSAIFDGLESKTPSGDTHSASVDINDAGASILTGSSNEAGAQVYDTVFSQTDVVPFAVDGTKESYTPDGDLRGLAVSKCVTPQDEFWFLGGTTLAQNTTNLVLANVEAAPTQVTITVWGENTSDGVSDDGSLKYTASRFVGVDARSEKSVLLSSGAPDQKILGVKVESTGTPVAATIETMSLSGLIPTGVDFVNSQTLADHQIFPSVVVSQPEVQTAEDGTETVVNNNIVPELSILAPKTKGETSVKAKFVNQDPNVKAIEKDLKLKDSSVLMTDLDFLTPGNWAVELTAPSTRPIVASIKQTRSAKSDGSGGQVGSAEFAYLNPSPIAENQLISVGTADSLSIFNANDDNDDAAEYTILGYNTNGDFLFNEDLLLTSEQLVTLPVQDLNGATFIYLQSFENKENKITASANWNQADKLANIVGTPVKKQSEIYHFKYSDDIY